MKIKSISKIILNISTLILGIYTSIHLYFGFYLLLNDYASGENGAKFGEFSRFYPFYLSLVISLFALIMIFKIFKNEDKNTYFKGILIRSIILISLSLIDLIIVVIKLIKGEYYFFMESFESLYPLNLILNLIFTLIIGIFFILIYIKKIEVFNSIQIKTKSKVKSILFKTLKIIYFVISMYYIGISFTFFETFDYSFKYFAYMIFVYILIFIPLFDIILKNILNELIKYIDKRKNKMFNENKYKFIINIVFSSLILISNVLIIIFEYTIANNFLCEAGTALFPLDHMLMGSPAFGIIIIDIILIPKFIIEFTLYIKNNKSNI